MFLSRSKSSSIPLQSLYKLIVSPKCTSIIPTNTCSFSTNFKLKNEEKPQKPNEEYPKPPDWDKFLDAVRSAQLSIVDKLPFTFATTPDAADSMRMWFFKTQMAVFKLLDQSFNEEEFLQGAKQAFLTVRPLLIAKDTTALQPMLTEKCYVKVSSFLNEYLPQSGRSLVGHVEQVKSVEIYNIRVRETDVSEDPNDVETVMGAAKNFLNFSRKTKRTDTIINVKIVAAESIAFVDASGKVLVGHTDVKDRVSIWSFERESLEGNWRVRTFVR